MTPAAQAADEAASARRESALVLLGERVETRSAALFRVHSRADQAALAGMILGQLEAVGAFYLDTVRNLTTVRALTERIDVVLLPRSEDLDALERILGAAPEAATPGVWWEPTARLLAADVSGILVEADVAPLRRAAAHVLNDRVLYEHPAAGSWWLREGLAMLCAQVRLESGRAIGSRLRRSSGYQDDITPTGRSLLDLPLAAEPKRAARQARAEHLDGRPPRLATVITWTAGSRPPPGPDEAAGDGDRLARPGRGRAAGPGFETAAATAWIVMHALLYADAENLRPRLARCLDLERSGVAPATAFKRAIADDVVWMESFAYRHVKEMD